MNTSSRLPDRIDFDLTTNEALTLPRALTPRCNGCERALAEDEMHRIRRPIWVGFMDFTCETCGWAGSPVARTIGELLTIFSAHSVTELADMIDEAQQGDGHTFIDFDESTQDYVFGYDGRGVELPFPVEVRELMTYMDEFEEMHLADLAARDDLGD